jgi:hypothetical protein
MCPLRQIGNEDWKRKLVIRILNYKFWDTHRGEETGKQEADEDSHLMATGVPIGRWIQLFSVRTSPGRALLTALKPC